MSRAGVGRLVGDVHHHARRCDRVRLARLRLLLLLDDPRRLSARALAGPGRFLAGDRRAVCCSAAWALTLLARRWNRRDRAVGFYAGLLCAVGPGRGRRRRAARRPLGHRARPDEPRLSRDGLGAGDLDGGPRRGRADHAALLRRAPARGRMTARYDIDIANVALYWHFAALTVVITVAVIAGFPAGGMRMAP